jgi:hypothetical protein
MRGTIKYDALTGTLYAICDGSAVIFAMSFPSEKVKYPKSPPHPPVLFPPTPWKLKASLEPLLWCVVVHLLGSQRSIR